MTNIPNQTHVAAAPVSRMNSVGKEMKDDGPRKMMQIQLKEVTIVVALVVLVLGGLVGGYWLYTQEEGYGGAASKDAKPVVTLSPQPVVSGPLAKGAPASTTTTLGPTPVSKTTDSMHADIYFDFDRSRLSADGVAILQDKAEVLKKEGKWSVLVQGYTDQHGPAEYNKTLAARRAAAVKQFLVELGVPETSIKVMTLGKEGAICEDQSKECQRLNRRVHLEMMKLNSPAAALAPVSPSVANPQPQHSSDVVSTSFSDDPELEEDQDVGEQDETSVLSTETEAPSKTQ